MSKISGKTTSGFYFGHTEAEGENKAGKQNLEHYFEDYLEVLSQIGNEKFIFVGRKGAGKSAIAKFIKGSCDKEEDSFADLIKFNDVELEYIIQRIPIEERKYIEVIIFEWLILVRIIKLFLKCQKATYTPEHKKLNDFINRNAGFAEIDKYHISEIVDKKGLEISFDVLRHSFLPQISKYIESKKIKAPFYQFVNPLKEIVQKILKFDVIKNLEFFILFDDLDIKFKTDDEDSKNKILALLRAIRNLNTTIFKGTKTKVLTFIRDDIKRSIETIDSDTSKLFSSYEILLNWYDHDNFKYDENNVRLKKFANKRISLNFEALNIAYNKLDPWSSLFEECKNNDFNGKSSFKFLIDHTFYRPRDIILFLMEIGNNSYRYPIDNKCFKMLIQKYVDNNVKELKSELSIHFTTNEINNLFESIRILFSKGITVSRDQSEVVLGQKFTNPSKIIELLLDYSIFILKDSKDHLYFNYRNQIFETVDFNEMKITPHKILLKYLDL